MVTDTPDRIEAIQKLVRDLDHAGPPGSDRITYRDRQQ